ncbi:MAG: 5-(carboxyamino)imidazole ribonucleotide mutase [Deltaproteobacteria bacterium]|nr:5-(carboxyamino)imidazole ribonucleotide mutase [Deltaproteobacteria bacterium]
MKKAQSPVVSIVMGSDSDLRIMKEAAYVLESFDVHCEVVLASAHRSPDRTSSFAKNAAGRGIKVIIAGAGAAAHLAGVIASQTTVPVIGVPINATPLNGMDALLSTVQMPAGVPVAAMALDSAGAKNAALLAVRILALSHDDLKKKLEDYAAKLARGLEEKQEKLAWPE